MQPLQVNYLSGISRQGAGESAIPRGRVLAASEDDESAREYVRSEKARKGRNVHPRAESSERRTDLGIGRVNSTRAAR